jgi:hypothetical protein
MRTKERVGPFYQLGGTTKDQKGLLRSSADLQVMSSLIIQYTTDTPLLLRVFSFLRSHHKLIFGSEKSFQILSSMTDLHRAPVRVATSNATLAGANAGGASAASSTTAGASSTSSTTSAAAAAAADDAFQIQIARAELRYETHGSHAPLSVFALVSRSVVFFLLFFFLSLHTALLFFFAFFFLLTKRGLNARRIAGDSLQKRAMDDNATLFAIRATRF